MKEKKEKKNIDQKELNPDIYSRINGILFVGVNEDAIYLFPSFFLPFFEWNRSLFYGEAAAAAVIRRGLYEKNIRNEKGNLLSISHSGTCLYRSFNRYLPLHSKSGNKTTKTTNTA